MGQKFPCPPEPWKVVISSKYQERKRDGGGAIPSKSKRECK